MTIFQNMNICVCFGLDKVVTSRVGIEYKDVIGELCTESVDLAIKRIIFLSENPEEYRNYKLNLLTYIKNLNLHNQYFKRFIKIFYNDLT